jgi:Divergent InlB B-repeat domain
MKTTKLALAICVLLFGGLAAEGVAHATSYTLATSVTTDGVPSLAGGWLSIACRASSSSSWGSCGGTVAAGTQVSIYAIANPDYWFMWFATSPYLAGCTTTNWGWGYNSNPATQCAFTMPSSNVSINAEFQLP